MVRRRNPHRSSRQMEEDSPKKISGKKRKMNTRCSSRKMEVDSPRNISGRKRKLKPCIEVGSVYAVRTVVNKKTQTSELPCTVIDVSSGKALITFKQKYYGRKRYKLENQWVAFNDLKDLKNKRAKKPSLSTPKSLPGGGFPNSWPSRREKDVTSPMKIENISPIMFKGRRGRSPGQFECRKLGRLKSNIFHEVRDDSGIWDRSPVKSTRPNSLSPTLQRSFQTNLTFTRDRSESPLRESVVPGEESSKAAWKKMDRQSKIKLVQNSLVTREAKVRMAAGRKKEQAQVVKFLSTHLKDHKGGSMFICGSPGTGKSATMYQIKKDLSRIARDAGLSRKEVSLHEVNGFACSTPQEVYVRLLDSIKGRKTGLKTTKAGEVLAGIFKTTMGNRRVRHIVVVDEIDGLLQRQQRVLYTLFKWPKEEGSNLILFGIANSITLTQRFLPNLSSRGCEPAFVVFSAYNKENLKAIIAQRLAPFEEDPAEPFGPFFDSSAIDRLVGKIASLTGDIRRTLEICRLSLDQLLKDKSLKKVTFPVMNRVLRDQFDSPFTSIISEIPFYGKTLVTTCCLFFARRSSGTYPQLRAFYYHLTKLHGIPHVTTPEEFRASLITLVHQGILSKKPKKQSIDNKTVFEFSVQADDVMAGVSPLSMLTVLLNSKAAIPKKVLLAV